MLIISLLSTTKKKKTVLTWPAEWLISFPSLVFLKNAERMRGICLLRPATLSNRKSPSAAASLLFVHCSEQENSFSCFLNTKWVGPARENIPSESTPSRHRGKETKAGPFSPQISHWQAAEGCCTSSVVSYPVSLAEERERSCWPRVPEPALLVWLSAGHPSPVFCRKENQSLWDKE